MIFKAPEVVDHVDAAPPVSVSAPPDVNCEAEVGVRLTAPAPLTLKLPEVSVNVIGVEEAVVRVEPFVYACCNVVNPLWSQSFQAPFS